jgi:hypothetical protein
MIGTRIRVLQFNGDEARRTRDGVLRDKVQYLAGRLLTEITVTAY